MMLRKTSARSASARRLKWAARVVASATSRKWLVSSTTNTMLSSLLVGLHSPLRSEPHRLAEEVVILGESDHLTPTAFGCRLARCLKSLDPAPQVHECLLHDFCAHAPRIMHGRKTDH